MKIIIVLYVGLYFLTINNSMGIENNRAKVLKIDEVRINCTGPSDCRLYAQKWENLKKEFSSIDRLKYEIKLLLFETNLGRFHYQLFKKKNKTFLDINFHVYPLLKEIDIISNVELDTVYLKGLLPLKEGDLFFSDFLQESKSIIRKYFEEKGHYRTRIDYDINDEDNFISVKFKINVEQSIKIDQILINLDQQGVVKREIEHELKDLLGAPFDLKKINTRVGEINKSLVNKGFIFNQVNISNIKYKKKRKKIYVDFSLNIKLGERYYFLFRDNKLLTVQELREEVKGYLKKSSRNLNTNNLKKIIDSFYKKKGIYNTEIHISQKTEKDLDGVSLKRYLFTLKEGNKIKIIGPDFQGNKFFSNNQLQNIFYKNASDLIESGYYDENYIADFSEKLKLFYVKRGFLFSEIELKETVFDSDNKYVKLLFKVSERVQTKIEKILIRNTSPAIEKELSESLKSQKGNFFNPLNLEEDLEFIKNNLKERGHYFTKILNENNEDQLLYYNKSFSKITINIELDLKEKIRLAGLVIAGNVRTKSEVITREIDLKNGDLITPSKIAKIKSRLLSLGIFGSVSVSVSPLDFDKGQANILIGIKEKDSGFVEVAPGFRNDVGGKLSISVGHRNLWGLNREVSLKAEVNQKVNTFETDSYSTNKLEYSLNLSYVEPYFLKWPVYSQTALSSSILRYPGDLTVNKLDFKETFRKSLSENWSVGFAYRIEFIENRQDNEEDTVIIGGITPSLTYDYRDSIINPTRGGVHSISLELARPALLAQDTARRKVDYYKLSSRNNIYFPLIGPHVLAISLGGGMIKNLAKQGEADKIYIPKEKVFRLSGIDNVRGFTDDEINAIYINKGDSSEDSYYTDIIDYEVIDKAYYVNLKVEPRFYLNDVAMLGLFFDTGGLFVDQFTPFDTLRKSVGLSLRFVTPVGSINASYGFKLDRKRRRFEEGEEKKESFGSFHLSIGSF